MLSGRRILGSDLCWTQGMPQWQRVSQVSGTPAVAAVPPPEDPHRAAVQAPGAVPRAGTAPAAVAAWPAPTRSALAFRAAARLDSMRYSGLIRIFVQAHFVKKIDPASPPRGFFDSLAVSLLTYPAMFPASFVDRPGVAVMTLEPLLMPVSIALFFPRSLFHAALASAPLQYGGKYRTSAEFTTDVFLQHSLFPASFQPDCALEGHGNSPLR